MGASIEVTKHEKEFLKIQNRTKKLDPCLVDTNYLTYLYRFFSSQLMSCLIFVYFNMTAPCRMNPILKCVLSVLGSFFFTLRDRQNF